MGHISTKPRLTPKPSHTWCRQRVTANALRSSVYTEITPIHTLIELAARQIATNEFEKKGKGSRNSQMVNCDVLPGIEAEVYARSLGMRSRLQTKH